MTPDRTSKPQTPAPGAPERPGAMPEFVATAIVQSTGDAIYAGGTDGILFSWNPAAEHLLGYSASEIIGKPVAMLYPPGGDPELAHVMEGIRRGVPTRRIETHRRHKDGRLIPVEVTVSSLFDDDGNVIGGAAVVRDITERQQAAAALAASEARFRSYFELPLVGIAISSPGTRWTEVNDRLCEMLGYTREELTSLSWPDVTHPDDVEPNLVPFARVVSGESDGYTLDKRFLRKDGTVVWASLAVRAIRTPDGSLDSLCTIIQDVTERHDAEQRVKYLNRVYAVLSDTNQMIVREQDPQATLAAACRIAVEKGNFRMAWIGMLDPTGMLMHPVASAGYVDGYLDHVNIDLRDPMRAQGPSARAAKTGQHQVAADIEHDPSFAPWAADALRRGYRSSGSFPLKVESRVVGVFNLYAAELDMFGDDELALLDELALDIGFALEIARREAERRRVEAALRDTEQRFRDLADNIDEVFWMVDPATGRATYVNRAFEQVWGRPIDDAYNDLNHWRDSLHPEDREAVIAAFDTRAVRGDYDITYRIYRPDGAMRWIHDRGIPLRDAEGVVYRIVGTARDITNQQSLEAQLRQAQKMEAVGQLAGGIAHDFNNILAAIMMETDLASSITAMPPNAQHMVAAIRTAAERAAALTRQLLAFSRNQVLQPQQLDLNDTVINLTNMLRRIVGEDVGVELGLHQAPVLTRADPGMVDQVLMNLAVNARDAMQAGGRLRIETGLEIVDDGAAAQSTLAPGRYVRLSVSDTGTGIPPELLSRIFEPFFTTKEPGKGTGLGLATVFGIVKQHEGSISVTSEPGEGTTFRILLPAVAGMAPAAAADAAPEPAPRGGSETILLVEDEPMVRRLARTALERAGYVVLEAPNGVQALEIWAEHRPSIRLLMTDLVMPGGVSGSDLATRLQADEPNLRVLFTSGYSADIAGRDPPLVDGQNFVQKPYRLAKLLEIVRRRLD